MRVEHSGTHRDCISCGAKLLPFSENEYRAGHIFNIVNEQQRAVIWRYLVCRYHRLINNQIGGYAVYSNWWKSDSVCSQ